MDKTKIPIDYGSVGEPKHLLAETKIWFDSRIREYELSDDDIRILLLAAESWDSTRRCQITLNEEGWTVNDRYGAPKKHPAATIIKEARDQYSRLMRQLALEQEPLD